MQRDGQLSVYLRSNVKEIGTDAVSLEYDGQLLSMPNDAVIVCAGSILPTQFLKDIGIVVETTYGMA